MLKKIQQVLRLVMLLGKQRQKGGAKPAGGLLVLVWTETEASAQSLNCAVATAGPWCAGIHLEALQRELTDVKESAFPAMWPCPQFDPEELRAFTDVYGHLRLLLSFQTRDETYLPPEWPAHAEAFFHTFTSANAGIETHLKVKSSQLTMQQVFRADISSKVVRTKPSLILDVTCRNRPPELLKKGLRCHGGHPVLGERLLLSIPPEAMDRGLFSELSVLPVTFLSPCTLQYPNLATRLTHIQVLVWGPSNVPVAVHSAFLQELPTHLDCEKLGLHGLHCSSTKDPMDGVGIVYTVEQDDWEDLKEESHPAVLQRLLLFLFLQNSDPFTFRFSDIMATEVLLERHLEDIVSYNRQAVVPSLQTEIKNALKLQTRRKKDREKLSTAAEVILSSSISIISCSTNVDFRKACLESMKVDDTHELATSLRDSLMRVISWKFVRRGKCYSLQKDEHLEQDNLTRVEI
ncbi:type 2 DNA topoisomerase 6 subunit B-like [Nelusetta ayraudi]|uniref:type 2 DNA topoisomerase 6 subunit B-like n=1 Tax=Nelusetta ayraudi TaxID=303726 RepID=UPI003F72770C